MEKKFRRINILITEAQHDKVLSAGLNLSGLVRDLLEDRFSDKRVVLSVTPETYKLYDLAISNFGVTDRDLERHFLTALDNLLSEKKDEIEKLRSRLSKKD